MLRADLFRERRSQLAKIVLLLCGFYFGIAFVGQAWRARTLAETLSVEQAALEAQQNMNTRLQARLEFLKGKGYATYVEKTAREQLGMIKPGDKPLFIIPDPHAPSLEPKVALPPVKAPASQPKPKPVWRQWVSVFFPRRHEPAH